MWVLLPLFLALNECFGVFDFGIWVRFANLVFGIDRAEFKARTHWFLRGDYTCDEIDGVAAGFGILLKGREIRYVERCIDPHREQGLEAEARR
jgi:hypothetical protein